MSSCSAPATPNSRSTCARAALLAGTRNASRAASRAGPVLSLGPIQLRAAWRAGAVREAGIDDSARGPEWGEAQIDDYMAHRYRQPGDKYSRGLGRARRGRRFGALLRGRRSRGAHAPLSAVVSRQRIQRGAQPRRDAAHRRARESTASAQRFRDQFFLRSKLPEVLYGSKPRDSSIALSGASARRDFERHARCALRLLELAHAEAEAGVPIGRRFVALRHRSSLCPARRVISIGCVTPVPPCVKFCLARGQMFPNCDSGAFAKVRNCDARQSRMRLNLGACHSRPEITLRRREIQARGALRAIEVASTPGSCRSKGTVRLRPRSFAV